MTNNSLTWRTSSHSGQGENSVDVAPTVDGVIIRHSKRHGDVIEFTSAAWKSFVHEARTGAASNNGTAIVTKDGTDTLVRSATTELRYNKGEWDAFLAGANDHEFDFATV